MNPTKLDIKIGELEFSGEGDEAWLAQQLDKVLANATTISSLPPKQTASNGASTETQSNVDSDTSNVPLGTFLKTASVGNNQVKRFLATAVWLRGRGNATPTTSDVTNALSSNHQPKLTNPADCLNQNVKKGFCEKKGKQFFVTPHGLETISATAS